MSFTRITAAFIYRHIIHTQGIFHPHSLLSFNLLEEGHTISVSGLYVGVTGRDGARKDEVERFVVVVGRDRVVESGTGVVASVPRE